MSRVYFSCQSVVVCFCCLFCLLFVVPVNTVNKYKSVFTGISLLNCRLDFAAFSCSYTYVDAVAIWNTFVTHRALRAYC